MVSSNRLLSCFLGFCYAYAFGWSAFAAESEVLGRVHIEENHFGKVVVAADDQPMRGTSVMMNKYQRHNGETRYFYDPEYWQMLRANGITALRIAVFDPWQRAHGDPGDTTPYPHGDFSDLYDQAEMFYELDYLIETAGKHGMSVLVNYHNTGGYRDPDHSQPTNEKGEFPYLESMDEVVNFWELVAPRYANRTH
ncbi:MAG: cellulase family glycosylhydrolase, partial [Lacipirellulaceae bacterium]